MNSTYQLARSHRLQGTASRQVYDKPNRGANAFNTPESTWHEHDILAVYQGLWNWVINDKMFVDTRLSYNSIDFPLNSRPTSRPCSTSRRTSGRVPTRSTR